MSDDKNVRNTRAEMEIAKRKSEKTFSTDPQMPRRYKLYDKLKDKVSLRTVDLIIIITVALIVALLVIGIVTGNR